MQRLKGKEKTTTLGKSASAEACMLAQGVKESTGEWSLPEVRIREAFVQISVMLIKEFRVCATLSAPSGNIMGST